jgi:hypothetical protein
MREDILKKIYSDSKYLEYIRYHPKWYYYLDQNPNLFIEFEKTLKKELKITTYDKLESLRKKVNFVSSFIKYMTKE